VDGRELSTVKRALWAAADELRANSTLAANEYRGPVLGLIFLAYAEYRFVQVQPELEAKATARRPVAPDDYRARSVLYLAEQARLSYLVSLPEKEDLGAAVDTSMKLVEYHNAELRDVLPKGYQRLEKSTLVELLRLLRRCRANSRAMRSGSSTRISCRTSLWLRVGWVGSSSRRSRSSG
jgi:type I restriction enzyme M protein